METKNNLAALALSLDWNTDPRPSPYQRDAWAALVAHPDRAAVLEVLESTREHLKAAANVSYYFPCDYAAKLKRGW